MEGDSGAKRTIGATRDLLALLNLYSIPGIAWQVVDRGNGNKPVLVGSEYVRFREKHDPNPPAPLPAIGQTPI
jgi:hypothetical protein